MRLTGIASTCLLALALIGCENTMPPMPATWAVPSLPAHQPLGPLPAGTDEGAGEDGSLLASYANRTPRDDAELASFGLPFQAKTMVVELLIAVAKDDPAHLQALLSDNARWGMPDRREFRARKIISEQDPYGDAFALAFRQAASRFSAKSSFTCTPLQPGWQMFAASGAEPVWCSYTSSDGLDIIGLRLIVEHGRVKTDYVGFFTTRLPYAIRVPDSGDPPPLTPYLKRPIELTLPKLMPDGSSPVLEKPKQKPEPVDAPIPVEAQH